MLGIDLSASPFGISHYASFIAAVLVFQLVPGPGTIAILGATASGGQATGMGAVAGTLVSDFLYMLAAIAGLSALLLAYPQVFAALQWLGIVYLAWLGIQLLRQPLAPLEQATPVPATAARAFRQAFLVGLTNPKAILFFVAFFPLFLPPQAAPLTLVALMVHVTVLSLVYQGLLVVVGAAAARRLAHVRAARWLATRLAGVALIAFGVRLALADR
jgi:leucine efflux protein